eukprot:scaffold10488_cov67-Cyclotella_meneghiniana.AAC.11
MEKMTKKFPKRDWNYILIHGVCANSIIAVDVTDVEDLPCKSIQHNCTPNCEVRTTVNHKNMLVPTLVALQDIGIGQEITGDMAFHSDPIAFHIQRTTYEKGILQKLSCRSKQCRGHKESHSEFDVLTLLGQHLITHAKCCTMTTNIFNQISAKYYRLSSGPSMKLTQGTQGIPGSIRKVQPATEELAIVGTGVRQGVFVTPEVVRSMVSKVSGGGGETASCVKGGVESSGVSGVRSARRADELIVRVRYAPGGGVSLVTMAQSSAESVHDLVGDEDLLFSLAVLGGEHQLVSIGRNIMGEFFMVTVFKMDETEEYQFTVCYDARLGGGTISTKHLFEYVMVPLMLAGANCRCRSGSDTHYWLGRGECVDCIRSRGEVPLGVRRVGNMFELVGGDAVDAARVAFVDALHLFLLLAVPTPECAEGFGICSDGDEGFVAGAWNLSSSGVAQALTL